MKRITDENMSEIILYLEKKLKKTNFVTIKVLNPSVKDDMYAGEKVKIGKKDFIYRSLKSWSDLAEILFCKLLILKVKKNKIEIKFQKLNKIESFHNNINDEKNVG